MAAERWSGVAWIKQGFIRFFRVVLCRCAFKRSVSPQMANYSLWLKVSSIERLTALKSKLQTAQKVLLEDARRPPYVEPEAASRFLTSHEAGMTFGFPPCWWQRILHLTTTGKHKIALCATDVILTCLTSNIWCPLTSTSSSLPTLK